MHTKLIGLCASLVALAAFAIAPALSSAQQLADTSPPGTAVDLAKGAKITGYSEGTSELVSGGLEVQCNENIITGTVTRNEAGKGVQGTIEDAWFQGTEAETKCRTPGFAPSRVTLNTTNGALEPKTHWCIETIQGTDKFKIEPHGCGEKGGSFTFVIDSSLTCGFVRTANIEGTFTTGSDPAGGTTTPATFTAGTVGEPEIKFETDPAPGHNFFCPSSGVLKNLTFKLYTDKGVTSNAYSQTVDTENPVWITAN